MTGPSHHDPPGLAEPDVQLSRWGGIAALAGVAMMVVTVGVVVAAGLPDASDAETLTDFADIESGRIAEHFLYLGAVVLFAVHVAVLHRLLKAAHPAASLFGEVIAMFGLVIMAASSLLHVSTAPLADLYESQDANPTDQQAIEYSWHAAQSVFDTMLATGVLLVPIGIALFGVAMWKTTSFGRRLAVFSVGLGAVGTLGAAIAVVDPTSDVDAVSVLAMTVFFLSVGWRTLNLGRKMTATPPTGQSGETPVGTTATHRTSTPGL